MYNLDSYKRISQSFPPNNCPCVCVSHLISSLRSFTWSSSFRMTKLSRYCNNLDPALFFRHDGSGLCYDLVDRVQFIIVRIKLCDKTVREITLNKCKLQYIIHSIYINALQGTAHRKQAVLQLHNTRLNFSDLFCILAFKLILSNVLGFTFPRHWAQHISFYLSIETFK